VIEQDGDSFSLAFHDAHDAAAFALQVGDCKLDSITATALLHSLSAHDVHVATGIQANKLSPARLAGRTASCHSRECTCLLACMGHSIQQFCQQPVSCWLAYTTKACPAI
jgi:hypothetical protein